MKQDLRDDLDAAGLTDRIDTARIYPTLSLAVSAYAEAYATRHGRPPP